MKTIRQSAIAGTWYPGTEKRLRDEINLMLDLTKPDETFENVFGIVVPHAGYRYSGKTAAYAYSLVKGKSFNNVIVISPSHAEYFSGVSVYSGDAYATPIGKVKVKEELRKLLVESSDIIFAGEEGHSIEEHALEIQLPFLQVALGDFTLVPIVIGDQSRSNVIELGRRIAEIKNEKTLVVASTDLSHFHNKKSAEEIDAIALDKIARFDYEGLQTELENRNCEACGGGGVVAMMKGAQEAGYDKTKVLHRTDSGEITGDHSRVVGYMSAVIYK